MLKEEHESIKEKSKRFLNVKKVINDIYKNKYNIKVTKLQNVI